MKIKIYTTPWCSHCKPYVENVKSLIKSNIELEVIDATQLSQEEIEKLNIRAVPFTIIEENGEILDSWVGNRINKIEEWLDEYA